MVESQLLPAIQGLRLIDVEFENERISDRVELTGATAQCPQCNERSQRIHSRYQRKLIDLPWAGTPVHIHAQVRRFVCRNEACPRRVFCERLSPAIAAYARRTERVKTQMLTLALATGVKERDGMKKNKEVRNYTDEPLQLGKSVDDFLPRPEDLVFRPKGVKVTITLSEESIKYFKDEAERLQTPYQRMIRNLIDDYVRQMRQIDPSIHV